MKTAAPTSHALNESVASLRRALRDFKAVDVHPSADLHRIVIELNEDATDNDRSKANALTRTGWESWPVIVEGPGAKLEIGRRRWG